MVDFIEHPFLILLRITHTAPQCATDANWILEAQRQLTRLSGRVLIAAGTQTEYRKREGIVST